MPTVDTKVLMRFDANIKEAQKKIRQLEKDNKRLAEGVVKRQEEASKALDAQIEKWVKIGASIGGAKIAYDALTGSARHYADTQRKEAQVAAFNIEKIQQAADGLLNRQEALTLAVKTSTGAFRLNQAGMEDAAKAAINLRNKAAIPLENALEEVTTALVEGNSEGLKKYGIQLKVQSDTIEAHNEILKEFRRLNDEAGKGSLGVADNVDRASKKMEDAIDKLSVAFGRLAASLTPVINGLAFITSGLADVFSGKAGEALVSARGTGGDFRALQRQRERLVRELASAPESHASLLTDPAAAFRGGGHVFRDPFATGGTRSEIQARINSVDRQLAEMRALMMMSSAGRFQLGGGVMFGPEEPAESPGVIDPNSPNRNRGPFVGPEFREGRRAGGLVSSEEIFAPSSAFSTAGAFGRGLPIPGSLTTPPPAPGKSFAEFLSGGTDAAMMAAQAMQTFESVGMQAFASLVSGSEGFAKAFRRAISDSLMASSMEMAAKALKHGVYALGALAFGGPVAGATAAKHGATAAKAGAAAVAMGAMARALGGGNSGTPAGAAGSAGGAATGAAAVGDTGSNTTVFVGSDFGDNPRASAARLSKALQRRRRLEGDDESVVFA